MRLLNTTTFLLEEFFERDIPKYAIVSHRWITGQEVSYEEFCQSQTSGRAHPEKIGWQKTRWFANLAREKYYCDWCWVDTCCIDKKSSAELTEAINSMCNWYRGSEVCVAYLSDVGDGEDWVGDLKDSIWFKRGWTLQELLAPIELDIYQGDGTLLGSKQELVGIIEGVTGISKEYLRSFSSVYGASVAERMCWSCRRETTRTEDIAYCLLGIFDVNMPLLYGEGEKAFQRLQYEIIQKSGDESIFAWTYAGPEREDKFDFTYHPTGTLAESLKEFKRSSRISSAEGRTPSLKDHVNRTPYSITNKGLAISVPKRMTMLQLPNRNNTMAIMQLDCFYADVLHGAKSGQVEWIYLLLVQGNEDEWMRIGLPFHITSFDSEYRAGIRTSMRTIRMPTRVPG